MKINKKNPSQRTICCDLCIFCFSLRIKWQFVLLIGII